MDGGTALGSRQAGLLQKSGALGQDFLRGMGHRADADLDGNLPQGLFRAVPGEPFQQLLPERRIGQGGRLRLGSLPLLRRRDQADGKGSVGSDVMGQKIAVLPQRVAVRVEQRGGEQPEGPAGRPLEQRRADCAGTGAQGGELEVAFRFFQRHRDEKGILGAGQRHIENAHFFAQCFALDGLGQRGVGQRLVPPRPRPGAEHQPHAQFPVAEHRAGGVAEVEFMGGPRHKHHGEFQTLGAVYRHNGHASGPGLAGGGGIGHAAPRPGGIHGTHQRGQAPGAGLRRPGGKSAQILPAALSIGHGAHGGQVAGAGKQLADQLTDRQRAGQPAVGRHVPQKGRKAVAAVVKHCGIEAAPRHRAAQTYKVVGRVRVHGAEQHGGQLHILGRIVQHPEQRRKGTHMRCIQQVRRHVRIDGNATGGQRSLVHREVAAAAQQDAEISIVAGAGLARRRAAHGEAFRHHPGNAVRNGAGIPGGIRPGNDIQLTESLISLALAAHHKALAVPVIDAAQLPGEKDFKEIIDPPDHPRRAAEIGVQRNGGRCVPRHGSSGRIGLPLGLLADENRGVRLAEPVNALFDVPHKEQIGGIRRGEGKVDGVLQGVGVLILVHQNGGVAAADGGAQRRAGSVRRLQQFQRQVFQVGVIQNLLGHLGVKERGAEGFHRTDQRIHQRRGAAAVLLIFGGRADQKTALQRCHLLFGPVPQIRGGAGGGAGLFSAGHTARLAPVPCGFQGRERAVPVPPAQPVRQKAQAVLIVKEHGGQGTVCGGVPSRDDLCGPDQSDGTLHPGRGRLKQRPAPGCLPGRGVAVPHGRKITQRRPRMGQRLGKVIELLHRAAGGIIGAPTVIQVGKGAEIGIGIGLFQHIGKGLLPQTGKGRLIGHREIRRHLQRRKVLLNKVEAEGIHRPDGRALEPHLLAAQLCIPGTGADFRCQTAGNIRPQLGRRGIGKGHDDKAVGVHRVLRVCNQPHHPLHQDPRFAGARRGRDQQAAAPGMDGRRLCRGKLNVFFRHDLFPFLIHAKGVSG